MSEDVKTALAVLAEVASQVSANLATHQKIQQALKIIADALAPKEEDK